MDPNENTALPPFDTVPPPAEADAGPGAASGGSGRKRLLVRAGAAALFVVALGFGQGVGLSLLFGDRTEHLSPETAAHEPEHGKDAESRGPAQVAEESPARQAGPVHVLDVARQRFEAGDVEGARRYAAAYLLQLDGLGREDLARAPEAFALLGDVMRSEFERSLAPVSER